MTRYRETNAIPAPNTNIQFAPKGSKKTINYIWMPDKNGNLVKKDAAVIKKSFANLSKSAQLALTEYIIGVQNRQPTDASRKALFNNLVDGAVAAYKQGAKETPWDVLQKLTRTAPKMGGPSIAYTNYDRLTSDALLSSIAKQLGFQGALTEADLADFNTKIQSAAKAGAKATQTIRKPDGTEEVITTPAVFDANQFAQNFLWAKVNIGDTKTLPTSVLNQIDTLRVLAKNNGIDYLSNKELANYALQIANGDIGVEDLQRQFNAKAAELYPLFGERLKANPKLTVYDLAEPYINKMAQRWEIDPSQITLSNPDLDKFLRPDGTAGKTPMGSIAAFDQYLVNHPNAEATTWANEQARQMATAFGRMAGYGV